MTKIHIRHCLLERSILYKICDQWCDFAFLCYELGKRLFVIVEKHGLTCAFSVEYDGRQTSDLRFYWRHTKGVYSRQVESEDVRI